MKTLILISVIFSFSLASIQCGGSLQPTAKNAHSSTMSYFKSYGKKYKETVFAKSPVTNVSINGIRSISYNRAQVDAFLALEQGEVAKVLVTMKKVPPFGWQIKSWEMLGLRQ